MKYFKLPDLGEGLPEAEIVEWHVHPGDEVKADQLLVSVETDKAIVDVPSPQDGVIENLFGNVGDILHTGEPLVEYSGEVQDDAGTVVGTVKTDVISATNDDDFIIGSASGLDQSNLPSPNQTAPYHHPSHRTTPAVRVLAKKLGVNLDSITGTGALGLITTSDVQLAHAALNEKGDQHQLKGVRRSMAKNMAKAHEEVVKVTLCDDADIHLWPPKTNPTLRLIRAIAQACVKEPNLNAWYEGNSMSLRPLNSVDIGIAVDTPDGLYVPVLRNAARRNLEDLEHGLNRLLEDVRNRNVPPAESQGISITLSNFGTIAGRYGDPVVVPPTVAIVGAGSIRQQVVAFNGEIDIHPLMPLSLSFDHRPVTGGEAARFLKAVIEDLSLES